MSARSRARPWFLRRPDADALERALKTHDRFLMDAVARSGFLDVLVRYVAGLDEMRFVYSTRPDGSDWP